MAQLQVIEEKPLAIFQLREEIEKIKKRDKTPGFRTTRTEDFMNAFSVLSPAKGRELFEKLSKLGIPRLRDNHLYKIIDLMPTTADSLKIVLSGYALNITGENAKKIVDLVTDYVPKK